MFGLVFSQIFHFMGFLAGLKGSTAAVVGGIGSIPGPCSAGSSSGSPRPTRPGYVSGNWADLVVFSLLVVVLLVRPSGLLGRARSRRSDVPDERDIPPIPERPDRRDRPRIGVDEWVAEREERTAARAGRGRRGHRGRSRRVPPGAAGGVRGGRRAPAVRPRLGRSLPLRRLHASCTRSSRSGSTSPSASPDCSTSATSRSTGSAPTRTRSSPRQVRHGTSTPRGRDPDRRRAVGAARPAARPAVAAPARRLPGDRDALLRPGVRHLREQREPGGLTGGAERDRGHRPARVLRLGAGHSTRDYYWFSLGALVVVPPRCGRSPARGSAARGRRCARTRSPRS